MRLRKTGKGKRQLSFLAAAFLLTLMTGGLSGPAHAACTNPPGVAGQQMYNVSDHVMQYCNAAGDWISMAGTTSAGGTAGSTFEIPPPAPCTITSGQMSVIGSVGTSAGANTVAVYGNTAFVGSDSNSNRLRSINISNPASMTSLQNLALGFGANDIDISADGTKIFTEGSSTDTFAVVDVSNPSAMAITDTLTTGTIADNGAAVTRHPTNPNYVYVTSTTDRSVDVANVTNPANISRAGGYTNATNTVSPHGMAISGNTLFVVNDTNDRITALNISTPGTPTLTSTMTSASLDGAWDIEISGNYAFVISKSSGKLASVNISNPASMTVVDTITDANISTPWYITIAGNYAFITSRANNKIVAVDISDPANLTVVDALTISGGGMETHMAVQGDTLYVPGYSTNLLYAVDLGCAPGGTTFELGSIVTPTCPAGYTYNEQLASCYEVHTTTATYASAKATCTGGGGYLLKPDSDAEEAFAANIFGTVSWFGLNDIAAEGTWVWENGDTFARTNWNGGEPNNTGGNEDCIQLTAAAVWNDVTCTDSYRYLCEAPATFADATCPPGYKFHPKAMKCMMLSSSAATGAAAKTACEADGGNLAYIMSADKEAIVDQFGGDNLDVWIGLSDVDVEGEYKWFNGVENGSNDYSNFYSGEPNGSADYIINNYTNGQWDDATGSKYYVCERDADEICMPENHNVQTVQATGGSSITMNNYTIPDLTDAILMVTVTQESNSFASTIDIPTATFDGIPMTRAGIANSTNGTSNDNSVALFYLLDPPVSTGNIVANFGAAVSASVMTATVVNCMAQEAPEAVVTNFKPHASTAAYTLTTPITTSTDLAFLVDGISDSGTNAARTKEDDQIEVASVNNPNGSSVQLVMSTRFVENEAGTYNMTWDFDGTQRLAQVVAAFKTNLFGNGGDNMGNEIATQAVDMQSHKITNAANPTNPNDGATKAYVDSKTNANETDPQVGTVNVSGNYCQANGSNVDCTINPSGAAAPPPLMAIFAEQQPSGTDATAAVTGSWQTHVLNTMLGNTIGASLNADEVTLPAGTYYIDAVVPFKRTDFATARLVDSSDNLLVQGSSIFCSSVAADANFTCHSYVRGVITLATSEDVKIQYYVQSAPTAQTLGDASAQDTEQYATLTIQKLN